MQGSGTRPGLPMGRPPQVEQHGRCGVQSRSSSEKENVNINIFRGIVPGLGGWQTCVYVFFSCHSLWREKH